MSLPAQSFADLCRCAGTEKPPMIHNRHICGQGEGILKPVFGQKNGGTKLPVNPSKGSQKV